jgi:hypothetical protein
MKYIGVPFLNEKLDALIKLVNKEFNITYKECQASINWVSLWNLKSEIIGLIETLREDEDERN